MTAIVGVWNRGGRPVDRSVFVGLGQAIHRNQDIENFWIDGAIAFGCRAEHQRVTFESIACIFDGRLDNRAQLFANLHDHPISSPDCPDSNLVAAAYDRFGDSFVDHLEGDFALGVFDKRNNRLLLARDRMGLRPLCYTEVGDTFLFASDAKALLAHPGVKAAPDDDKIADSFQYFPSLEAQSRTFFQGIRSLPPAHVAVVSEDRVAVRRYFEFDTERRVRFPNFRDYADAFHGLFVNAVRYRLRSKTPVAISVSGGLDSSYIFCAAQRLVREEPGLCPAVIGLDYGGSLGTPSDEIGFVRDLERACEVKIEHIEQPPGFMKWAEEEVWYSESPDLDAHGDATLALYRRARDAGAGVMITGHWGDQFLSDSNYLLDLIRSGKWWLLASHSKEWGIGPSSLATRFARDFAERHAPSSGDFARRLARDRKDGPWREPWLTARFRRILFERFTAERLPRRKGTSHAWSMYQQARLSYPVHCMEWNSRIGAMHGMEMGFPFLDRNLIQFLMSIPGEIQSRGGISRGLMREAMRGIVPDAIAARRGKADFTYRINAGVERQFATIGKLLGPNSMLVEYGYTDGPVLWKMLDQWRTAIKETSDCLIAWRIVRLCGLEIFLRSFFGDSKQVLRPPTEAGLAVS